MRFICLKSKEGGRDENEIITLNILMYSSTQPLLLLSGVGGWERGLRGGGVRGLDTVREDSDKDNEAMARIVIPCVR